MIVVDTNIIVYFYLESPFTQLVEQLHKFQPVWAAPALWKSEFRNVLALYLRKKLISFDKANEILLEAESLMDGYTYDVRSKDVMRLVNASTCSAYDCEFVALATYLDVSLVTLDKKVLKSFPHICVSLKQAIQQN